MVTPLQVPTNPSVANRSIHSNEVDLVAGSANIDLASANKAIHPAGGFALIGLRLSLGFLFFWAFLDKTFGLGYATPSAHAWIRGGSPTKGFLSGANVGPLQGFFRAIAGVPGMDWLFMIGLLGIGLALLLGVALRPAAITGSLLVVMMWLATWPPATMAGGQPTGSNNPFVDEHILETFAFIVIAVFATKTTGYLGRRWADLNIVKRFPWLQ
jgi:thiosulfate dehydrogenase [quinone] large subunit